MTLYQLIQNCVPRDYQKIAKSWSEIYSEEDINIDSLADKLQSLGEMLSYMPSSPSENILLSLSSYKGENYITEARLFHKKDLFEKLSQIAEIELPDPDLSSTQEELSQYLSDTNYLIPQEIEYSTADWGEILRATVFGDNYNLANNGRILFLTAVFFKQAHQQFTNGTTVNRSQPTILDKTQTRALFLRELKRLSARIKLKGDQIITRNEMLLTVTDENEERLLNLLNTAKKETPSEYRKRYPDCCLGGYLYSLFEAQLIGTYFLIHLALDMDDDLLYYRLFKMREELERREAEKKQLNYHKKS